MICPGCSKHNDDGDLFCIYCGQKLPQEAAKTVAADEGENLFKKVCPKCSQTYDADTNFCYLCGTKLTEASSNEAVPEVTSAPFVNEDTAVTQAVEAMEVAPVNESEVLPSEEIVQKTVEAEEEPVIDIPTVAIEEEISSPAAPSVEFTDATEGGNIATVAADGDFVKVAPASVTPVKFSAPTAQIPLNRQYEVKKTNRCTACLKDNAPDVQYCVYCGNALGDKTTGNFDVVPKTQQAAKPKNNKTKKIVLIAVISVLVLAILSVALCFVLDLFGFSSKDTNDDAKETTQATTQSINGSEPQTETATEGTEAETQTEPEVEYGNVMVEAGMLTAAEIQELDAAIADREKQTNVDICFVITENYDSSDSRAEDFVSKNGDMSMAFRVCTASGFINYEQGAQALSQTSEETTQAIMDSAADLLGDGKVAEACKELLKMIYPDEISVDYEMVEGSQQVVYVTKDKNSNAGKLVVVDWKNGADVVFTIDRVYLGKDGLTTNPSESVCATPEGTFPLGFAFSDELLSSKTKLEFKRVKSNMVWVDDPGSKYYNTLQSKNRSDKDWESAEETYEIFKNGYNNACILIEHNGDGKIAGVSGRGSCIYIAGKEKDLTESYGDVNIPAEDMTKLLAILDKDCNPCIVIR